jgi:hypothetical protein
VWFLLDGMDGDEKGDGGWGLRFGGDVGANFFCMSRWIYPGIGVWGGTFFGMGVWDGGR